MGNALGAIVFLGVAGWLGYEIIKGRAQALLLATSGGTGGAGAPPPANPQANPITGPLAGIPFVFGPQGPAPPPNVYGDVFGQNGSLFGPNYSSEPGGYGPYSPQLHPGAP